MGLKMIQSFFYKKIPSKAFDAALGMPTYLAS